MRQISDQLKSRNLVPFKKRHGRYNLPGMTSEPEALMDRVDADLSPEEQGFIRHYLGYADAFLRSTEHIVPEPLEASVGQDEREEVREPPAQAKENPTSKAA
ncbi:MAG TPA: hypothetical protein VGJ51_03230 [Candidatus Angelobacter sp.]|jgi:hypothetical protein